MKTLIQTHSCLQLYLSIFLKKENQYIEEYKKKSA